MIICVSLIHVQSRQKQSLSKPKPTLPSLAAKAGTKRKSRADSDDEGDEDFKVHVRPLARVYGSDVSDIHTHTHTLSLSLLLLLSGYSYYNICLLLIFT